MTQLSKVLALAVSVVTVVTLTAGTALAGFYPADRQTYTCNGNICPGADHVTFNSFVNNPVVGDERPFFAGSIGGANVQDRMKVKDGDTIVLRAYVHNNADPNKIGAAAAVAKNTKIKVLIPTAKQADSNMVAFISADNANPAMINDTMSVYGDSAFNIEYVAGSAKWTTNSGVVAISDNIVAGGASLGSINGCFQYSGYVTLTVKIKMDTPPKPPTQSLLCSALNLTILNNEKRQVKATVAGQALNGATITGYSINFGDGTTVNQQTAEHTYAKDGSYKVVGYVSGTVDGKSATVTSAGCAQTAYINVTPPPTPEPTPTPTPETPVIGTSIPNTGAEGLAALTAGVSGLGAAAHQLYIRRRK
jgi:PKD repeat protein